MAPPTVPLQFRRSAISIALRAVGCLVRSARGEHFLGGGEDLCVPTADEWATLLAHAYDVHAAVDGGKKGCDMRMICGVALVLYYVSLSLCTGFHQSRTVEPYVSSFPFVVFNDARLSQLPFTAGPSRLSPTHKRATQLLASLPSSRTAHGPCNAWVVKPCAASRGLNVTVFSRLEVMLSEL